MKVTELDVRTTYAALCDAKTKAALASRSEAEAKQAYENARAEGLVSGAISGKNETEREAAARKVCATELDAWQRATGEAWLCRHMLDMAALAVEELRLLVRLDEIEAFAGGALPPSREG